MKIKLFVSVLFLASPALAHQPVFDMAPRWAGGYGFQIRVENQLKDRLEKEGRSISNPSNLRKEETTTWFEGIYTFDKAFRITFKMPYLNKSERRIRNGQVENVSESGTGDLIVGFPTKLYFNRGGYTGNWSLTPSFYLPTGKTGQQLELGRGTVDYGLSASFSIESFRYYTLFDVFGRLNTRGDNGEIKGNSLGIDWDIGIHPYHDKAQNRGVFLMVGLNGRHSEKDELNNRLLDPNSGGQTAEAVPTLVLYWSNWMWRTQYHIPVYAELNGTQLAPTYTFMTGIGLTF